ncbi:subtilisin-like serine protease PR1C [Moelleriella libera RCEF 2490]|uniref:Subtilisin-like serine protease PR1C n=1 Tax=Moelleriella libera RCEF 2490 TaxID=1081109 RepID=A0A167YSJ4_9HYPO|nr:subtilisin-like serine protease PR1C [Moelleriella libera RCEF 2490]
MTQVDRLRAKGIRGKGIKIAIVDSGIDYKHPLLGGCFGKGCLVSFGADLVGDFYTGHNTPIRDDDPLDCDGHGTHVAGIVAARRNPLGFTGAAPDVKLGAYRILGCKGSVSNDLIAAAFLEAFEAGANIITMSISGPKGWNSRSLSSIVRRIVRQGVPCLLSAGNAGPEGQFYASASANGHHAAAVAAYETVVTPVLQTLATYWTESRPTSPRQPGCSGILGHLLRCPRIRSKPRVFTCIVGVPNAWGVSMPLFATSWDPVVGDDACESLPDSTPNLRNFIVLVRNGGCIQSRKAKNIAAKGAKYMILVSEKDDGIESPDSTDCGEHLKAVAMVNSTMGLTWIRSLASGAKLFVQVSDTRHGGKIVNKQNSPMGGAVSRATTWGPTFDMEFEPQFGAPGRQILSTYPVSKGGFAILSGASMACPLVAAIYALIYEARRGRADPFFIKDLVASTAKPQRLNLGHGFLDYLAPVSNQGSGIVQAYDAAFATSLASPSSLSFNDTDNAPSNLKFTLSNKSKIAIKYTLGSRPAVTVYTLAKDSIYPMRSNDLVSAYPTLSFTRNGVPVRRFTLQPGGRAVIEVKAHPPRYLDARRLPLWSGYLTINGTNGSALSLAYQGLIGSLRSAVVLAPDQAWIFTPLLANAFRKEPDDTTFLVPAPGTSQPEDINPAVNFNLALGSPLICVYIVPVEGEQEAAPIGQHALFPQTWVSRGNTWKDWDGKLNTGAYVPPGRYIMVVKALRIYGDRRKEEDWDTAKTQPFILQYK